MSRAADATAALAVSGVVVLAVSGVVVLAVLGCGAFAGNREEGRLEARWTGAEKGRLSAKASAIWCRDAKVAALTALQGDSGLGLLIHASDSLVTGQYPIAEPASARSSTRGASVGLRLLSQLAVVGYQGKTGTLTLDEVGARLSGRFDASAQVVTAAAGTITLTGRFLRVPVTAGTTGCPR